MTEPKQKKRTRRKRTKRLYFTQVHEDAILEYCASRDRKKREDLYRGLIQPAMSEMVDKIVYTYSYFSVITKNWFIHKVKKHSIQRKKEIQYDDIPRTIEEKHLSTENPYEKLLEKKQFWQALWSEIEKWGEMPMKPTEERVYKAVKILMETPDDIEIFNKKAIYLYLRQLTGLNTKQVVNNLNKLRVKYRSFKSDWNEGKITHIEDRNDVKKEPTKP